ncbi:MAG: diadenylate cyclase CdaA [bacterium]|nr:diadenylate cyclase CdaA [bacterium]
MVSLIQNIVSHWRDILDILLVTALFYGIIKFLRGTRSVQVIQGLIILVIATLLISFIAQRLELTTIAWIINKFWTVWLVALIVIFAPDIRRTFAQLGQQRFFRRFFRPEEQFIIEIVQAVSTLAKKKHGALIVFERDTGLQEYMESGVKLDSSIVSELILSIFTPYSPLHDGAVILQGNRIAAAGCLLPLTQETNLSRELGMRHRAAIGLTEETDALVIVVSEETGSISVARGGKLTRDLDPQSLRRLLRTLFGYPEEEKTEQGL